MRPWAIYGITKRLTEKIDKKDMDVGSLGKIFKKSLHIFVVDAGCSNQLNFEMDALMAPQYNIHRFGIFFTDSPRHADLLILLGRCNPLMVEPIKEVVDQLPEPFGILLLEEDGTEGLSLKELGFKKVIGYFRGNLTANDILSILLNVKEANK